MKKYIKRLINRSKKLNEIRKNKTIVFVACTMRSGSSSLQSKLHGYFKRNPKLWYHPFVVKTLKFYLYFWFSYLFEKLYWEKTEVRGIWSKASKIVADIPHRIQHFGSFEPISQEINETRSIKRFVCCIN